MRRFVFLALLAFGGWAAYDYYSRHPDLRTELIGKPALPTKDSQSKPQPPPQSAPIRIDAEMENIPLKDGRTIRGKIVIWDETFVWIRTPEGKQLQIKQTDLARPIDK